MLERSRLSIGPWRIDADGVPVRKVRDPDAAADLGFLRWMTRKRHSIWRLIPPRISLELHETDDRALVMSLRPSPLASGLWIVRECDDNEVGRVRGNELLDPWSEPFARRTIVAAGWSLAEFDGRAYATCTQVGDDDLIQFGNLSNPFLRMLIVGSFLLLRPRPE